MLSVPQRLCEQLLALAKSPESSTSTLPSSEPDAVQTLSTSLGCSCAQAEEDERRCLRWGTAVPKKEVGEKMTASLGPSSEAESARAMRRGSEVGVAMLTILEALPG